VLFLPFFPSILIPRAWCSLKHKTKTNFANNLVAGRLYINLLNLSKYTTYIYSI